VAREADGSRGITHITEVMGYDLKDGQYLLRDLFVRHYQRNDGEGRQRSELVPSGLLPSFLPILQKCGTDVPRGMYAAARTATN
jgi:pilus assembly protein CpaF